MAKKLGTLFLNAALGQVNFAGSCVMNRKVDVALNELNPVSLMGSVERGIATVASMVQVPPGEVSRLLPLHLLEAHLAKVRAPQETAVEQWSLHTGHIGGLLDGVANLTHDGRAPDTVLCLRRLARKLKFDKPLAQPLGDLADSLETWEELLYQCRAIIDEGKDLRAAYRQRVIVRWIIASSAAIALALAAVWWGGILRARGRVDAALSTEDPCAVRISEDDRLRATGQQQRELDGRMQQCAAVRGEQRRAAEKRRLEEERKQEIERKRQARLSSCSALATHLKQGAFHREDAATAGQLEPLLRRVATTKLRASDLTSEVTTLPCGDTPSGTEIAATFARAVFASRDQWAGTETLSKSVLALLEEHAKGLTPLERDALIRYAEGLAKEAVMGGHDEVMLRADRFCRLMGSLGLVLREQCAALHALMR